MSIFSFLFRRKKGPIALQYAIPGHLQVEAMGEAIFDEALFASNGSFSKPLAFLSFGLALTSFSKGQEGSTSFPQAAFDYLKPCGFKKIEATADYFRLPTIDTLGAVFGYQKIKIGKKKVKMIAIGIRGGNYGAEWASNVTIGSKGPHEGIAKAGEKLFEDFLCYLQEKKIRGPIAVWVSGFSRAAGAANCFVKRLVRSSKQFGKARLDPSHIYAYAFASPRVHLPEDKDLPIYNLVNPGDLVPTLPFEEYGLIRSGQEIILPETDEAAVAILEGYGLKEIPFFSVKRLDYLHILDSSKRIKDDPLRASMSQGEFLAQFGALIASSISREDYATHLQSGAVALASLIDSSKPSPYGELMRFCRELISFFLAKEGKALLFHAMNKRFDWGPLLRESVEEAGKECSLDEKAREEVADMFCFVFSALRPKLSDFFAYLPTLSVSQTGHCLLFAHEPLVYYALLTELS